MENEENTKTSQSELEANLTSKIKQLDEKNDQLLKDLGNYQHQNIEQQASVTAL